MWPPAAIFTALFPGSALKFPPIQCNPAPKRPEEPPSERLSGMNLRSYVLIPLLAGAALAAPNFSQVGFSTLDGGTTGGLGGMVVRPADVAELKKYAEDPVTPYVILISKEMNTGLPVSVDADGAKGGSISSTYGAAIMLGSNKSIIGIGDKGFFNRVGIIIQKKKNIIIRNIRFTMKNVPISKTDENKMVGLVNGVETLLGDPDCIGIQADSGSATPEIKKTMESRNIWIDHCEFYNENPTVMTNKDRYDGLLDAKNNTFNVTVSWNYFHDHHKGCLIGNSDSDDFEHKFTFHHNHFNNILSRQPLIRFGKAHIYNNYIHEGGGNGVDVRINSDILIEKNQFAILSKAVFSSDDAGKATLVDNVAVANSEKKTTLADLPKGSFTPPYPYTADAVGNVISLATTYSGVGKISTLEYETTSIVTRTAAPGAVAIWSVNGKIVIRSAPGLSLRITDAAGHRIYSGRTAGAETAVPVPLQAGVYMVESGAASGRVRVE
jgi:pectate lyase